MPTNLGISKSELSFSYHYIDFYNMSIMLYYILNYCNCWRLGQNLVVGWSFCKYFFAINGLELWKIHTVYYVINRSPHSPRSLMLRYFFLFFLFSMFCFLFSVFNLLTDVWLSPECTKQYMLQWIFLWLVFFIILGIPSWDLPIWLTMYNAKSRITAQTIWS